MIVMAVALGVLLLVVGCSNSNANNNLHNGNNPAANANISAQRAAAAAAAVGNQGSPTPAGGVGAIATPGGTVLQPGQSASVGGLTVTMTSAGVATPIANVRPQAGDQHVEVAFTVGNDSQQPYTLSTVRSFVMFDKAGQRYPEVFTGETQSTSLDTVIAPGRSANGSLLFEVPTNNAPYTVQFVSESGSASATWAVPVR
jgi:hypothetical protein